MNSHTVNDVINMSLPMLEVTGSEKDVQLRVTSGKNETSYPLIGHEHPYGIKMSHLQTTALLPQELEDSTSPPLQEDFLLEKRCPEVPGQFNLKPRHPARSQQGRDPPGQKTAKKSSVRNWAFWWRSSTHQDNQCPTPPSAKPRQLFGVPLMDVCEDDKLPTPIPEMLKFINQKGPLIEGIFRKSASIKLCRALKEELNSGDKVNLEDESVPVVASVIKAEKVLALSTYRVTLKLCDRSFIITAQEQ
ncbi:rho GTPase-activating protein 20-like [Vicugna pacos]|uniref:Rho GTPase-activating protein 20-like n=1 Tax=Vicugna pacos TaxID=30538 RepID=A0ABM5E1H8_VICPA